MDASRKFGLMLACMVGDDVIESLADDWWFIHAPEPEPPDPEPPDDWQELDEDDVPYYDTPGGY